MYIRRGIHILGVLFLLFAGASIRGVKAIDQGQAKGQNQSQFSRPILNQESEISSHPPIQGAAGIAAGGHHACALDGDGKAICWGDNRDGQLGNGSNISSNNPVEVINLPSGLSTLVVGGWHTCAITDSGGVVCWGNNFFGQLGDGTNVSKNFPVSVTGLSSGVIALAAGEYHTCALTH